MMKIKLSRRRGNNRLRLFSVFTILFTGAIGISYLSIVLNNKDTANVSVNNPIHITTPTPTIDPMKLEYERIEKELHAMREENKRMTELVSRGRERKPSVILDYNKLSAPRYIVELTERMCNSHGFDSIRHIYAIMGYESNFDPTCHATKGEDSRGLLQVNVGHPAHASRHPNKTKLFDPAYNLDYQLDELSEYYKLGQKKGLSGVELTIFISKYGQRPKWSKNIETLIRKYDAEYLNSVVKGA
jgi:hypothetical protein